MMPTDRFDRQLPALLDELAAPRTPDYFESLLGQTARTRQRPAWTILERWLPMVDVARQPVIAPRLPLRAVGLGLLLIGLIVAVVAALAIGSRPNLPAPFGPAQKGLVAYSADGDIFVGDSVSGQSRPVITGPENDQYPVWSRDGTRFAFERKPGTEIGPGLIFVARADGSQLTLVTPKPLEDIRAVSFSPDGRHLLLSALEDNSPSILIANVDGSGIRHLDVGRPVGNAAWRPPLGNEILFTDVEVSSLGDGGIYTIRADGGAIRTILPAASDRFRGMKMWSPNGTRIAYGEWVDSLDLTVRTHIINADGTGDHLLASPSGGVWEAPMAWSNDGTRLLSIRGYDGSYGTSRAVARPVDGTDTGVEIHYPGITNQECCSGWEWAPDDASILGTASDLVGEPLPQVVLDPRTGTTATVPWSTTSGPTWQRLAP
jgi:dipeptidyl aminopeptidase/acylaminoacyl peptidase